MRTVVAQFMLAVALAIATANAFTAITAYLDRERARAMDARALRTAPSLYDARLINACGRARCAIGEAGQ